MIVENQKKGESFSTKCIAHIFGKKKKRLRDWRVKWEIKWFFFACVHCVFLFFFFYFCIIKGKLNNEGDKGKLGEGEKKT